MGHLHRYRVEQNRALGRSQRPTAAAVAVIILFLLVAAAGVLEAW